MDCHQINIVDPDKTHQNRTFIFNIKALQGNRVNASAKESIQNKNMEYFMQPLKSNHIYTDIIK